MTIIEEQKIEKWNIKLPSQYSSLIIKQINDLSEVTMVTLHRLNLCAQNTNISSQINYFLCLKNSPLSNEKKDNGELCLGKSIYIISYNGP